MSSASSIFDNWRRQLENTIRLAQAKGCSRCELNVGKPAPDAELVEVERQLGRRLPPSFRQVLLGFAGSVEISWFLPDAAKPPEPKRALSRRRPDRAPAGAAPASGFDTHGVARCPPAIAEGPERLIRPCARAPLSLQRISELPGSRIAHDIKNTGVQAGAQLGMTQPGTNP